MIRRYYSRRQLVRMLHLAPRQLGRWQRRGLFPRRERYGWQDLLRARALRQYEQASIGSAMVARSLSAIRRRLPELADPLAQASLGIFGHRLELRYAGVYMDALSGQFRLPFELGRDREHLQVPPTSTRAERRHEEAEQWFSFALSLEGEPDLRDQAAAAYQRCLELDPGFSSAHPIRSAGPAGIPLPWG